MKQANKHFNKQTNKHKLIGELGGNLEGNLERELARKLVGNISNQFSTHPTSPTRHLFTQPLPPVPHSPKPLQHVPYSPNLSNQHPFTQPLSLFFLCKYLIFMESFQCFLKPSLVFLLGLLQQPSQQTPIFSFFSSFSP